jgi:hypothetical protein
MGGLRRRLYELYDQDEAMIGALVAFHSLWWDRIGSDLRRLDDCLPDYDDAEARLADRVGLRGASEYLGEFRAIVDDAGLDRIGMVGIPPVVVAGYLPSGSGQAHRYLWHLDKALLSERAAPKLRTPLPPIRRPTFETLSGFGAGVPVVNTVIAGTTARWDPRTELLAHTRRRLHAETELDLETVEAELGRIRLEGSYRFPDTSTRRDGVWRLDRDAQWVWWRIRRRLRYAEIAREWAALHPNDLHLQLRADDEARKWDQTTHRRRRHRWSPPTPSNWSGRPSGCSPPAPPSTSARALVVGLAAFRVQRLFRSFGGLALRTAFSEAETSISTQT